MKPLILAITLCISTLAYGSYNNNYVGVIHGVYTYTDGDYIYIQLENQPQSHPGCKPNFFVIADDVPYERRQVLLSRLLLNYATGKPINLGYDDKGDCAHGYIRVHRVG
jgi:hypothetical protein